MDSSSETAAVNQVSDARSVSVLMISLDPGLATVHTSSGDVLARHKAYARFVRTLDIIVLGGTPQDAPVFQHDNLTVYTVGRNGLASLLKGFKKAAAIIDQHAISLIVTQDPHATGWLGARLKKKFHIPLIVHLHGDFLDNPHWRSESLKNRLYAAIQEKILTSADGIRAVSGGIYEKLVQHGIPKEKIVIINTPINDALFSQLTDKQKIMIEKLHFKYNNKHIILFCGRLVMAKNIPFMLEVMRRLKAIRSDFLLLMVGEGKDKKLIEDEIQKRQISDVVLLIGPKKHAELVLYYRLADFLVLLSTNESFGKVIIEAGLCETPALASATTGATSIIQDGHTGFIVPINDYESTISVLQEMLEYRDQTKMLGGWARQEYLKKFASDTTYREIVRFWSTIAHANQPSVHSQE